MWWGAGTCIGPCGVSHNATWVQAIEGLREELACVDWKAALRDVAIPPSSRARIITHATTVKDQTVRQVGAVLSAGGCCVVVSPPSPPPHLLYPLFPPPHHTHLPPTLPVHTRSPLLASPV